MSGIPSVSQSVGLGAGLLGGYASSNYQNYLGNTIRQVLAGNQFQNVFGTGLHTFLDITRIWQTCNYISSPFSFDDTPTSEMWSKWQNRLGYLGIDLGVITKSKDEKSGKDKWAGWTWLNVGDISTLNYKGNMVRVNRAVCQINYTTAQNLDLQWAYVEAKIHSYFWWIWGVGIASMFIFQIYNTQVSQNQEVQEEINGSMTWKMINIALELVQFLVLKKMSSYQQQWTAEIMELEINAASALKLDDTEILVTMDKMKSLESDLLRQIIDASNAITRVQAFSGAALQGIATAANQSAIALAKTQASQQSQFAALLKANKQAQYDALIAEGVLPAIVESQLLPLSELCISAQTEADLGQKNVELAEEKLNTLSETAVPIENLQTASINCDTSGSNASGGAVLNPSLADLSAILLSVNTEISQQIQLQSDSAVILAEKLTTAVLSLNANSENRIIENTADTKRLENSMAAQESEDVGGGSLGGNIKRFFKYGDIQKKRTYGPTLISKLFS